MGALTTAGGAARVVGPIVLSRVYENAGLYWTFGMLAIILAFTFLMNAVAYRWYVPGK